MGNQQSAKINVAPSANPIQKRNVHHVKKGPVAVKKKSNENVKSNQVKKKQTLLVVKDPKYLRGMAIGTTWSKNSGKDGNGYGITLLSKNSKHPPANFIFDGETWGNDVLLRESVSKCSLEVTYRSWKVGTDIVLWTIKGYPGCKFNTKNGKICVANQGKYKGNASLCVGFSNRSPANCLVLVHSTDKSALTFFQNDSEARKHYEATKYPTGLLRISNPKQYAGYYIGAAYEVVDKKVICSTGLRLEKDAAKAIRIVQDGPGKIRFSNFEGLCREASFGSTTCTLTGCIL